VWKELLVLQELSLLTALESLAKHIFVLICW